LYILVSEEGADVLLINRYNYIILLQAQLQVENYPNGAFSKPRAQVFPALGFTFLHYYKK
jgi:hypothetical protein